MKLLRLAFVAVCALAYATPAAAQRYTAVQNGELVELRDTTAQMKWMWCRASVTRGTSE